MSVALRVIFIDLFDFVYQIFLLMSDILRKCKCLYIDYALQTMKTDHS